MSCHKALVCYQDWTSITRPKINSYSLTRLTLIKSKSSFNQNVIHYEDDKIVNSYAVKVFSEGSLGNRNGAPEKEFAILKQLDGHANVIKAHEFVRGNGTL